jgi:hypothetical protein
MKYFENLPKTKFESTIGSFTISDFFTYIDFSKVKENTNTIDLDDKSTLIEAASKIYNNPDSFWSFIIANKKINPLKILPPNANIFNKNEEGKYDISLTGDLSGTTSYVFPRGSIILPYQSNSGNSASFSSVGNFNIDGPFSLIDDEFYGTSDMITKKEKNGTLFVSGVTGNSYVLIYPNSGGSYSIQKLLYTQEVKTSKEKTLYFYDKPNGKFIVTSKITATGESKFDSNKIESINFNYGTTGDNGSNVTVESFINTSSKTIKSFTNSFFGKAKSFFITAKFK